MEATKIGFVHRDDFLATLSRYPKEAAFYNAASKTTSARPDIGGLIHRLVAYGVTLPEPERTVMPTTIRRVYTPGTLLRRRVPHDSAHDSVPNRGPHDNMSASLLFIWKAVQERTR